MSGTHTAWLILIVFYNVQHTHTNTCTHSPPNFSFRNGNYSLNRKQTGPTCVYAWRICRHSCWIAKAHPLTEGSPPPCLLQCPVEGGPRWLPFWKPTPTPLPTLCPRRSRRTAPCWALLWMQLAARRALRNVPEAHPGVHLPLRSPSCTAWPLGRSRCRLLYSHLHTEQPPGSSRNTPSLSFFRRRHVNSNKEKGASKRWKTSRSWKVKNSSRIVVKGL